jgi:6-pyruvoyltetrahydropterin/6-carboxytetrahydropterin synthase
MFTVTKTFPFCYGHRLLRDEGKCRHLHGHTAKAAFSFVNDSLDSRGMVVHFDRIKETIGAWIAQNLDHAMLLCRDDPMAKRLDEAGERFYKMGENPTAENIAKMLFTVAKDFGFPVLSVEVWESETAKATYSEPLQ